MAVEWILCIFSASTRNLPLVLEVLLAEEIEEAFVTVSYFLLVEVESQARAEESCPAASYPAL